MIYHVDEGNLSPELTSYLTQLSLEQLADDTSLHLSLYPTHMFDLDFIHPIQNRVTIGLLEIIQPLLVWFSNSNNLTLNYHLLLPRI